MWLHVSENLLVPQSCQDPPLVVSPTMKHFTEMFTPLKINGWNIIPWRFGSDHFPFQMFCDL